MTEINRSYHLSFFKSWLNWFQPVDIHPLAVYRIAFGLLMLFSSLRFLFNGWIEDFYITPQFHFSYLGFEWLPFPSPTVLYIMFGGIVLTCVLIILGLFYRIAIISFFVLFTYVELLDKTTYLNHYYFVSLIAFLMIFLPANRYFSFDVKFKRVQEIKTIPAWTLGILKFQMAVVYIFAGIAKLEYDWLFNAQPLKYWLHTAHHWPLIGNLLKEDWVAYFFSWGGCIYDLLIVFFLLNKKTRNYAYLFVIFFHLTTWLLFPIGVFPWVMMVGTTIFLDVTLHKKFISFFQKIVGMKENLSSQSASLSTLRRRLITFGLSTFILFQVLVPFRYLAYSGNLFWTEQGFRFSWRVMLMEKVGYATFYLSNPESDVMIEINNSNHLTPFQEKQMSFQPDMILQYAHYLGKEYEDTTVFVGDFPVKFDHPEVRAEIYVALNGRPSQLFVSRDYILNEIPVDLSHRYWLEPYPFE